MVAIISAVAPPSNDEHLALPLSTNSSDKHLTPSLSASGTVSVQSNLNQASENASQFNAPVSKDSVCYSAFREIKATENSAKGSSLQLNSFCSDANGVATIMNAKVANATSHVIRHPPSQGP
ncbi:MAG: hypothetical protein M1834_005606 [Cirrosporium novae-zelandiae]|nr:MAG: hypothetical protein M1834_005606 [Cirrosporium novae-zelandiae]